MSGDAGRETTTPARSWRGIDHVQVAIPDGAEDAARAVGGDVHGLTEVPEPPIVAACGGAWLAGLHEFVDRIGLDVRWSDETRGAVRCHVHDPFGNRIGLVEASS